MGLTYMVNGLTQSQVYAFRYRALNAYGWGQYSAISLLLVATEPQQAKRPSLIAATDTSLHLLLDLEVGNNGAPI